MSLGPGTRVGAYHVLGAIGAGGMGEVYRARDAKLQRDVALKSLPESFLIDPGRRARFEREALTLAALNHPHIAQVFGLEEAASDTAMVPRPVLVMELIEGEDLSDRTARGRLPLREALKIARQIATAIEAAHAAGVIHRDLKPSNIRVRPDGVVKVLDFGLARGGCGDDPESHLGTDTITTTGAVLGSAAYMSPEQARGLAVDGRTDIWSFGCVLFELLTGRRAFAGGSRSDTIAAVLSAEPDFSALPPATPPPVRRLLRRCLAKDPAERLHAIADARLELDEPAQPEEPARSRWRRAPGAPALALLAVGALAGGLAWHAWRPQPSTTAPIVRFELRVDDAGRIGRRAGLAISPDGEHVAYSTSQGFVLRARGRLVPRVLEGIGTFPGAPFFSPDGQWLAYVDAPVLKKISTSGGAPIAVSEVGWSATGDWTADGIVMAGARGLYRVSPDGGPPEPIVTELDPGEQVTAPQLLPGGAAALYTVIPTRSIVLPGMANVAGARIEAIDLQTRVRKVLIRGGSYGRYTTGGHLVYLSGGSLHAVGFDEGGLELLGRPTEVVSGPIFEFAVSSEGTLAYAPAIQNDYTLVWVDRQGREDPLGAPPQPYLYPRISPDGTRVALDVLGSPDRDIWIWDLRRKTLDRFTVDTAGNPLVAWSRDGRHLAFGSDRSGHTAVFMQPADGSGTPEQLMAGDRIQMPLSFAPDGRLLFSEEVEGHGRDIHALALDGSGRVQPLVATTANELNGEVSPDGKWLAYDSNESGQFEVYVRPYPNVAEGRLKISQQGGRQPLWSPDGRELFYRDFSGAVLAVPVRGEPTFTAGEVSKIIDGAPYAGGGPFGSARTYDIAPDGRRLLMIKRGTTTGDAHRVVVIVNWFDELKRLVPVETRRP